MSNEKRRNKLGEMFLDIAKYLATVGLIGSILQKQFEFLPWLFTGLVIGVLTILGFYVIPSDKEGEKK
jgi:hypothetical protein